jgi:hypothetical protein
VGLFDGGVGKNDFANTTYERGIQVLKKRAACSRLALFWYCELRCRKSRGDFPDRLLRPESSNVTQETRGIGPLLCLQDANQLLGFGEVEFICVQCLETERTTLEHAFHS